MRISAVAAAVLAVMPVSAQPGGNYQFVQIAIQAGAKAGSFSARNALGTITFGPGGELRIKARRGTDRGPLQPFETTVKYEAGTEAVVIPDPSRANGKLKLRFNHDKSLLIGASEGAADPADLFLAARAPAPGASPKVSGDYAGAYLSMKNGDAAELSTAFVEFSANESTRQTGAVVAGHVAGIDDVVRVDSGEAVVAVKDGGTGTMTFKANSDVLMGNRDIVVSADGGVVLGFSTVAGVRDALILVKRAAMASNGSVRGLYWMAEITAETPFVFAPAAMKPGSAFGSLRSEGDGRAHLSQQVRSGGRALHSTVLNSYLLSGDGTANMGPKARYGLKNLALSGDGSIFVGAQSGGGNDLVLDHGIFVGVKAIVAPAVFPAISVLGIGNASIAAPGPQPMAPGSLVAITGSGFAADARVTVDGQPATAVKAGPDRIEFLAPAKLNPAGAAIQVSSGGKQSSVVTVPVSVASPALVTETGNGTGHVIALAADGKAVDQNRPAAEGETIALAATGMGTVAASEVKVTIGGKDAETVSIGPAPNQPGVSHVKVKVPKGSGGPNPVPVAIAAGGSFTDLADLAVQQGMK